MSSETSIFAISSNINKEYKCSSGDVDFLINNDILHINQRKKIEIMPKYYNTFGSNDSQGCLFDPLSEDQNVMVVSGISWHDIGLANPPVRYLKYYVWLDQSQISHLMVLDTIVKIGNYIWNYKCLSDPEAFLGRVDTPETQLDMTALPLDEETRNMCVRNGLLPYIQKVDDEIIRVYKNVIAIKHRVLDYGDTPKEERLRFEIYLTGESEEILQSEKKLHAFLFNQIPEEKQHFFSLTYRIP